MSEKKKRVVRVFLGLVGGIYIVGGLAIPTKRLAQSYYHWLGADWHMGADLGAFLLTYGVFMLAAVAVGVAFMPPKALEPKP